MAKMGKYCKAFQITRFREFGEWSENRQNARKEKRQVDGKEVDVTRDLTDQDFLYLQENFVVTDGIFIDENIIFDTVTVEWVDFCKQALGFEAPSFQPLKEAASSATD